MPCAKYKLSFAIHVRTSLLFCCRDLLVLGVPDLRHPVQSLPHVKLYPPSRDPLSFLINNFPHHCAPVNSTQILTSLITYLSSYSLLETQFKQCLPTSLDRSNQSGVSPLSCRHVSTFLIASSWSHGAILQPERRLDSQRRIWQVPDSWASRIVGAWNIPESQAKNWVNPIVCLMTK